MSKFFVFVVIFSKIVFSSQNLNIETPPKVEIYEEIIVNESVFKSSKIPDYIYEKMLGNSIPLKYKEDVNIENLSYLQITYFGFDNETHIGEMIVNKNVAKDVLEIFEELYEIRYPIEKIRLIDEYGRRWWAINGRQ